MTIEKEIYLRRDPIVPPVPVLVDVSRSGRLYPIDFRSPVPFTALHDNVSMYVEEIWDAAPTYGATFLQALFPNTYVDANRNELDVDPELIEGTPPVPFEPTVSKRGLGLLKSKSRYGEPMHERKLTVDELMSRLDRFHRPYHKELKSALDRFTQSYGFAYQLSCHCMSAIGAPTHPDHGKERMDFCLGNLDGTSSSTEFLEFVESVIKEAGYTCSMNFPYKGGELNRRYGDPSGRAESIMIEINKRRFMDVKTFQKNEGFDEIKRVAEKILAAVSMRARQKLAASH